jgi:hypothetical protein
MNKTDHDTAIIKPPLQQYNDPRLDHPCPSVLNSFTDKNEKERKLTSINMKVSNLLHNQRTTLAEQNYRLGALLNQRPLQNMRTPYYTQKNHCREACSSLHIKGIYICMLPDRLCMQSPVRSELCQTQSCFRKALQLS